LSKYHHHSDWWHNYLWQPKPAYPYAPTEIGKGSAIILSPHLICNSMKRW
jgi:hypothetical protein